MSAARTAEIVDAVPASVRIARQDLVVGDTVFDVYGGRYAVIKVKHTRSGRTTIGTRDDGARFYLSDDDTITVIRGGAA